MKRTLLIWMVLPIPVLGLEFSARVIDGLGRPVPDITFEVKVPRKAVDGKAQRPDLLKLKTDHNGLVKGSYDAETVPEDQAIWVYLSKDGYESYSTELRSEYVLERVFNASDVRRISKLTGEGMVNELRELLAGEFKSRDKGEQDSLKERVFYHERQLRPALRALVKDEKVGKAACDVLAFVGDPQDMRIVIQNAPPPKLKLFEDRWAYGVVSALVEPASEAEWDFLRKCALNEYDDRWVDGAAIRTLKLIASPKSLEILKAVKEKNPDRKDRVENAIEYASSNVRALSSTNLLEAATNVALAIKIGEWQGNKEPRYNEEGDMALVESEFIAGRDLLVYTTTFHKVGGYWKYRGSRETMQALLADPPEKSRFVGAWHGLSEDHLQFVRLELSADGTGLMVISYLPNSAPDKYRIKKWSQNRFQLDMEVEAATVDAEAVTIKDCGLGISSLEFDLRGRGWSRKIIAFSEAVFQKRANETLKAAQELKQGKE